MHDQLFSLHQGKLPVADYAVKFRTLAATGGWNEAALITAYRQGLNSTIRQQMAIYVTSLVWKALFNAQSTFRLYACLLDQPAHSHSSASPPVATPAPEPMQVDTVHLCSVE